MATEDKGMYSVFDIADWFVHKETMPQKKLQKLCYYSQAWYKALFDEQLFKGSFEAWVHGPVHRELWNETTQFGYEKIKKLPVAGKELPVNIIDFLEDVYFTYGSFDGEELERLTHTEEPWLKAREGLGYRKPSNKVVTLESMGEYYKRIANIDVSKYGKKAN